MAPLWTNSDTMALRRIGGGNSEQRLEIRKPSEPELYFEHRKCEACLQRFESGCIVLTLTFLKQASENGAGVFLMIFRGTNLILPAIASEKRSASRPSGPRNATFRTTARMDCSWYVQLSARLVTGLLELRGVQTRARLSRIFDTFRNALSSQTSPTSKIRCSPCAGDCHFIQPEEWLCTVPCRKRLPCWLTGRRRIAPSCEGDHVLEAIPGTSAATKPLMPDLSRPVHRNGAEREPREYRCRFR